MAITFREDKHIIIPILLLLGAFVVYGAWKDMHPPPSKTGRGFQTYNIVRNDSTMRMSTSGNDADPLMIWVGDVNFDKTGKPSFVPSPVTPVTLPQREVILFYRLNEVPQATGPVAGILADSAEKWKDKGDIINDIFIEAEASPAKLPNLLILAASLRVILHENYWLGLYIDRQALEALPEAQKELDQATKGLRTIYFDAKTVKKPGESLADAILALNKYEFPFLLRTDEIPDFTGLQQQLGDKAGHFLGFLLDTEKIRQNTQ